MFDIFHRNRQLQLLTLLLVVVWGLSALLTLPRLEDPLITQRNAQVVTAFVPLANMFGYINALRSFSQGRANFTMQYDHYETVPQAVADEVIKKYA